LIIDVKEQMNYPAEQEVIEEELSVVKKAYVLEGESENFIIKKVEINQISKTFFMIG